MRTILLTLLACASALKTAVPVGKMPPARGGSRFFLDTADTAEWEALLPLGVFHGVTTNPTLLERAGVACTVSACKELKDTALRLGANEIMVQAWGESAEDMCKIGLALSALDSARVVVKVPITAEGTVAAAELVKRRVRVCLTACYAQEQALVAASVGAEYLAPYLGRMTDAGKDGLLECERMQQIVDGLGSTTRILVASIRETTDLADLATVGLDTFTFSPEIARALFEEPLTLAAAEAFDEAARNGGAYEPGSSASPPPSARIIPLGF